MTIMLKRAYEKPSSEDGTRVLVERLWPRGVKKENACIDQWPKDIAPSPDLRKWYSHDPAKWPEFKKRYWAELEKKRTKLPSSLVTRRITASLLSSVPEM